ncbi:hypothetical protein CCX01_00815 [Campylobacter jejuni]|nr:hypothetical protein [Campylobacter jejuni]
MLENPISNSIIITTIAVFLIKKTKENK